MAKKHRRQGAQAKQRAQQQRYRPAQRVHEGIVALSHGDTEKALSLATGALHAATDPATSAAARRLAIEARFRAAAAVTNLKMRLAHLDAALQLAPEESRLHYHRALTLWALGRIPEALPELAGLQEQSHERPEVAFLYQLACAVTGQPCPAQALPVAEAKTMQLLQGVFQGASTTTLQQQAEQATLLGKTPALWATLLSMKDKPTSAPVVRLQAMADDMAAGSAVMQYYLGVGAMRKGDVPIAQSAWRLAAEAGSAMPWFVDNYRQILRAQAYHLGQEGRWHDLVAWLQMQPVIEPPDAVLEEMLGVAHAHLGEAAAQANDWSTAAQHWQAATTHNPNRQLFQNLALAREALQQWRAAAEAWREVLRRRPRKQHHPEAVTDAQMATLWRHVAECYERVNDAHEMLTCLKNAVKYAPADLELGVTVADISSQTGRDDAAMKELERLLAINAQYVPALLRLGTLYHSRYDRDAMPLWRRVLAIEPHNEEARQALAQLYVEKIQEEAPRYGWFDRFRRRAEKEKIAFLEEGLRELPNHPTLLMALGEVQADMGRAKQARQAFTQAWEAAPQKPAVVAEAIHNLLHAGGGDIVQRLFPTVRQITGLPAMFWVSMGRQVLQCELGQDWVDLFWSEALTLAAQNRPSESMAYILWQLFDAAHSEEAPQLAARYEARLRAEYSQSGAVELIEAYHAVHRRPDASRALRLLRQAQEVARQANEPGIATMAEQIAALLRSPAPPPFFDLLAGLGGRGARRGRRRVLDEVFAELAEECEEEIRRESRRHFSAQS